MITKRKPYLTKENAIFVAEVKTKDLSGWKSAIPWQELLELAIQYGDIVSIHVDPRWDGSIDLIHEAYALTSKFKKPILAKGLTRTTEMAHEYIKAGASYVLVSESRVLTHFEPHVCWHEFTNNDMAIRGTRFLKDHVYVVNARDISRNEPNKDNWDHIRRLHKGILVQASYIQKFEDVKPDADIFIVGKHLPEFIESIKPFIP